MPLWTAACLHTSNVFNFPVPNIADKWPPSQHPYGFVPFDFTGMGIGDKTAPVSVFLVVCMYLTNKIKKVITVKNSTMVSLDPMLLIFTLMCFSLNNEVYCQATSNRMRKSGQYIFFNYGDSPKRNDIHGSPNSLPQFSWQSGMLCAFCGILMKSPIRSKSERMYFFPFPWVPFYSSSSGCFSIFRIWKGRKDVWFGIPTFNDSSIFLIHHSHKYSFANVVGIIGLWLIRWGMPWMLVCIVHSLCNWVPSFSWCALNGMLKCHAKKEKSVKKKKMRVWIHLYSSFLSLLWHTCLDNVHLFFCVLFWITAKLTEVDKCT